MWIISLILTQVIMLNQITTSNLKCQKNDLNKK